MDVLAVSAETTNALIAASAALGGAIVGGVITTGATWWLERKRDAADLREARRLVAEEVSWIYFVLNALLQDKAYPPSRAEPNMPFLPTEHWEQHRNALARHLNDKEWRVIASSMDGFRIAEVTMAREKPGPIPPSELRA